MGESGEVDRETALQVLRNGGVGVSIVGDKYTLSKGEVIETHNLQDPLSRRMVHYLSRTFDVPVHLFYNPGMQIAAPPSTPPSEKS